MAIEQRRSRWSGLFVGAVLGLMCGTSTGCEMVRPSTRTIGSLHMTGDGMYEGVLRWREQATPEDRAVIDELIERKDLVIHIFLKVGFLHEWESRGGASSVASSELAQKACDWHPKVADVPWNRNWDVIYDPERTRTFQEDYGIPTPVEVVLHHEIFGHILPLLRNPKLLPKRRKIDKQFRDEREREAIPIENLYRRRLGLREVSPELMGLSPP